MYSGVLLLLLFAPRRYFPLETMDPSIQQLLAALTASQNMLEDMENCDVLLLQQMAASISTLINSAASSLLSIDNDEQLCTFLFQFLNSAATILGESLPSLAELGLTRFRRIKSIREESYGFWEKQVMYLCCSGGSILPPVPQIIAGLADTCGHVNIQQVTGDWKRVGSRLDTADKEDEKYKEYFRMTKSQFENLAELVCPHMEKQNFLTEPIEARKRLAIFLTWVATGSTYKTVAALYDVSAGSVSEINHECAALLREHFVPQHIKFPQGADLLLTMAKFKELAKLPGCVGALDGTFFHMCKPKHFGDDYWCYKAYHAIMVLACVDADGHFQYVSAGMPGSCGDANTWHRCSLKQDIEQRNILSMPEELHAALPHVGGHTITPYIAADSAFPLSSYMMKCYETKHPTAAQFNLNYAIIRTRRVVECAFGRLKGRFQLWFRSRLTDPRFAEQVALVCCALHNYIETTTPAARRQFPGALLQPHEPAMDAQLLGIARRADPTLLNPPRTLEGKRGALAQEMMRVWMKQPAIITLQIEYDRLLGLEPQWAPQDTTDPDAAAWH